MVSLLLVPVLLGAGVALWALSRDAPGARARTLRRGAFAVAVVLMAPALLFTAGSAVYDPGGAQGALLIAGCAVPLLLLVALVERSPGLGSRVLVAAVGVQVAFTVVTLLGGATWRRLREDWGPVDAVVVMVLGAALAFLGRHLGRATLAGWLMVAASVLPAVATALARVPPTSTVAPATAVFVAGLSTSGRATWTARLGTTRPPGPTETDRQSCGTVET